jgi:hypothetical protein
MELVEVYILQATCRYLMGNFKPNVRNEVSSVMKNLSHILLGCDTVVM